MDAHKQNVLAHLQAIQQLSNTNDEQSRGEMAKHVAQLNEVVSQMISVYKTKIAALQAHVDELSKELVAVRGNRPVDRKKEAMLEQQIRAFQAQIQQLTAESSDMMMILSTITKRTEGRILHDTFTMQDPAPSSDVVSKAVQLLDKDPNTKKISDEVQALVKKMHALYANIQTNDTKLQTRSDTLRDDMKKLTHALATTEEDKQTIAHMFDLMNQSIKIQCEHEVQLYHLKKQVVKIVSELRKEGTKIAHSGKNGGTLSELYDKMDEEKKVLCDILISQATYQDNVSELVNRLTELKNTPTLTNEQRDAIQALVGGIHQQELVNHKKESFTMTKKDWIWLVVGYVLFLVVIAFIYFVLLRGSI